MSAISFTISEMRKIDRKKADESRYFSVFNGNDRGRFLQRKKVMQRPGKIEDMRKKIYTRGRRVLQPGVYNSVWKKRGWKQQQEIHWR